MRVIVISAVLAAAAWASGVRADRACFPAEETDIVHYQVSVQRKAPNDVLHASLYAQAEGNDPAELAQQVSGTMRRALEIAAGTPAVKVKSGSYATYPIHDRDGNITRWRVRQELQLESGDFPAAGRLIGELQGAALKLSGMHFGVAPATRRNLEAELTQEVIEAFRARAEEVRAAWKAKGYEIKTLSLISGGGAPPYRYQRAAAEAAAAPAAPVFEGGDTDIMLSASGSIRLKN
jgi:predicted secreted protein